MVEWWTTQKWRKCSNCLGLFPGLGLAWETKSFHYLKQKKRKKNNGAKVFFDSLLFFKKHNTEINVSNVVAGMDLSFPIFLVPFFSLRI